MKKDHGMKHDTVREYYGKTLQTSADLKTNACCTPGDMPTELKAILSKVHDEVLAKYYGCGLTAPHALRGARILDLGSGSGRDVYALSAMVGPEGSVVGVDMTPAQLDVARRHREYHADAFGYSEPNTEFHEGLIEELDKLPLEPGSFDIIVSNCVLNLAMDKDAVLRGAYRLLKPGGERYFSDVYADRRIPADLRDNEVLYGECLSGALYWNDFENKAKAAGFLDPRLVEDRPLEIENAAIEETVGRIAFSSATYRLFKLDDLEPACEDYGQAVIYKGTIENAPNGFALDKHRDIETGKVFPVCGNTWRMLADTRFAEHFEFIGNWDVHYGIFDGCGGENPFTDRGTISVAGSGGSCC